MAARASVGDVGAPAAQAQVGAPVSPAQTGAPAPVSPGGGVVLVVDDEPANLELVAELLHPEGLAELVPCRDPRQAIALFEAHAPDLVLLDLHMPHLDGFQVLREIQRRTAPDDLMPVLVLTADASPDTRARALSSGASDFLTKPLDALEVRLRVRNLLRTRRLHRGQRSAREAAEAAIRARDLVLSVVAHDLRNPLASIAMDAEMVRHLLTEEEHPAQRRTVARMERTAQRMHALIEDLLEVSRLQAGTLAIRPAPTPPVVLLHEAGAMLEPLARARGIRFRLTGPDDLPPVLADGERVIQVLSNLVGNAIGFTPPGGDVEVAWGARGGELEVAVRDTGPGIPADQLPHVFEPFRRGGGARAGLGLGLTIARSIVEAHGGRIALDSPAGGTTVRFSIPFAPTAAVGGADVPGSFDP